MSSDQDQPRQPDAQRFAELWQRYAPRVQAYALRHVDPSSAQEIVAETFLVAWRRLSDVPGQPLPWLLVVARNTIYSQRRSVHRARVLEQELARLNHVAMPALAADVTVVERADVLRALPSLTPREREALFLVSSDGLTPAQAAEVAGCSPTAFKVRLHRARRRLQTVSDEPHPEGEPAPHTTAVTLREARP